MWIKTKHQEPIHLALCTQFRRSNCAKDINVLSKGYHFDIIFMTSSITSHYEDEAGEDNIIAVWRFKSEKKRDEIYKNILGVTKCIDVGNPNSGSQV